MWTGAQMDNTAKMESALNVCLVVLYVLWLMSVLSVCLHSSYLMLGPAPNVSMGIYTILSLNYVLCVRTLV